MLGRDFGKERNCLQTIIEHICAMDTHFMENMEKNNQIVSVLML